MRSQVFIGESGSQMFGPGMAEVSRSTTAAVSDAVSGSTCFGQLPPRPLLEAECLERSEEDRTATAQGDGDRHPSTSSTTLLEMLFWHKLRKTPNDGTSCRDSCFLGSRLPGLHEK